MTADHSNAHQRIRDALVRKFMEQIELRPVEAMSRRNCDSEQSGWELYAIHWRDRRAAGPEEYLAYHSELDNVIIFGEIDQ